MKTFTIENETNSITVHASAKDAKTVQNAELFSNEAGLAKLAADWPAARLIEIWNSIPGVVPVRKFKDRQTAVSRIWKAIQDLNAGAPAEIDSAEPEQETVVAAAPEERPATVEPVIDEAVTAQNEAATPESAEPATATPVAPQTNDVAPAAVPATDKATRAKKEPKPATKREGSKTETILALMKQPGGATLKAIMAATGWQAHSVRGFVSGTLSKKMGLTVASAKAENGERTYSINA